MRRLFRILYILTIIVLQVLATTAYGQTTGLDQYLSDRYRGKRLLLRGLYPQDRLLYDSAGSLVGKEDHGDWTSHGFVVVDDVHISGPRLILEARRPLIVALGRTFQFHTAQQPTPDEKGTQPVSVEITVDFGKDIPAVEQADNALSRIFLSAKDDLGTLIPDYWKPCVTASISGRRPDCSFSPEVLAVPGIAPLASSSSTVTATYDSPGALTNGRLFRVGDGVSTPKVIFQRDPEFSPRARQAKFQGTMTLMLVVNREGVPTNIHLTTPLGCGLDAKAVQAVGGWRFKPAEKDGQPVAVEIAVEVTFHLY